MNANICMDIQPCYIASDFYVFDVRGLKIILCLMKIALLVKNVVEAGYVGLFLPSVKRLNTFCNDVEHSVSITVFLSIRRKEH